MTRTKEAIADPLMRFPGYLIRRASVALLARLNEDLAELDLRHVDSTLLQLIGSNPGIKQSEACRVLEIQRANMVPLIARLEKRGLIKRTPIDGRSQGVSLTRSGRVLAKKAYATVSEFETGLLAAIPEELREHVTPILLAIWDGCSGEIEMQAAAGAS